MKKVIIVMFLCIATIVMMITPSMAEVTSGTAGTVTYDISWYEDHKTDEVLYISDAADLLGFSYLLSSQIANNVALADADATAKIFVGKTIMLTADIDLNPGYKGSDQAPANVWYNVAYHGFTGMFDGQGHTVSGIYLDSPTQNHTGIFGSARGGTEDAPVGVKNLVIINSYVGSAANNNGGLFASAPYFATSENSYISIENVYLDVNLDNGLNNDGLDNIGGFIGYVSPGTGVTINNCIYAGSMTLEYKQRAVGGFVGFGDGADINISNSAFTGSITGHNDVVSRFIGRVQNTTYSVDKCLAVGMQSTEGSAGYTGTFISQTTGSSSGSVTNSIYTDILLKGVATDVAYGTAITEITATNNRYVTEDELNGSAAQVLLTAVGMTDWAVTDDGIPVPATLKDIIPESSNDTADTTTAPETTAIPETTSVPETAATPATTAQETVTTTEPAVTTDTETTAAAETTDNSVNKSGCGSIIAGGTIVFSVIAAAFLTMRKKAE